MADETSQPATPGSAHIKVTWHPDAMDRALATLIKARDDAWALKDEAATVSPEQARIRLNKIANDLLFGDAVPVAIDTLRAWQAGGGR